MKRKKIKEKMPYEKAKNYARTLGLKSYREWDDFCKSGKKPNDMPTCPHITYKKDGVWTGWGDFLGTGTIPTKNRTFLDFKQAREMAQGLGLKDQQAWQKFSKEKKLPPNLPSSPYITYKESGWKGWSDFLGYESKKRTTKQFLSYEESKAFMKTLGLKSTVEWQDWKALNKHIKNIPSNPSVYYKDQWESLPKWLGYK